MPAVFPQSPARTVLPPPIGMRVSVMDHQLEVAASLTDAESVDRLIKILEANKSLLPPKVQEPG